MLWHKEQDLQGCEVLMLPGGFSYGDYLRSGAIARFSPIMAEVQRHAQAGRPVIAVCNGFQIACEAGLLPGALLHNHSRRFTCKNVYLQPQGLMAEALGEGHVLQIPIAHGEGRYYADDATLDALEARGQILFRYCDSLGAVTPEANPNGSERAIAGICNAGRNVFGMMPHPERADPLLGNTDGRAILQAMLDTVQALA